MRTAHLAEIHMTASLSWEIHSQLCCRKDSLSQLDQLLPRRIRMTDIHNLDQGDRLYSHMNTWSVLILSQTIGLSSLALFTLTGSFSPRPPKEVFYIISYLILLIRNAENWTLGLLHINHMFYNHGPSWEGVLNPRKPQNFWELDCSLAPWNMAYF